MAKSRTIVHLGCRQCGLKNYSFRVSKRRSFDKLELSKYCRKCGRHSLHRETK